MASSIEYDKRYDHFFYTEGATTSTVVMNADEIKAGVDYLKWAWEQLGDATAINGDALPYKTKREEGRTDGI
jgi:hypothetical protein